MLELYSITIPSASRAATQKARTVTAAFVRRERALGRGHPTPGNLRQAVGLVAGGAGAGAAGAEAFAGIFSFWPTLILSVVRLFSDRSALTVTPNCDAI